MKTASILFCLMILTGAKLLASDTLIVIFNQKDVRQKITIDSGRPRKNVSQSNRYFEKTYTLIAKVPENDTSTNLISYKIIFNTKVKNQEGPSISKSCFDSYSSIHLSDIKTVKDFEYLRRTMYKKVVLLIDETRPEKVRKAITVYPMFLEPIGKDTKIQF